MTHHHRVGLLRNVVICGLAACMLAPASASDSLTLPDGRRMVAGGDYDAGAMPPRYSFIVYRYSADGSLDTSFDGDGAAIVPIWDYYEFADALALQPDGKIVVGGNAADPAARNDPACYPAFCRYYPALIRLNADGSLDRSFNGNGKLILAIGDANSGAEVGEFGTLTDITLDPDGRIVVWGGNTAVARVNADGTLDKTFTGTSQVASEYASSYQGLWWGAPAGSEPGWGLALTQQGDVIVADWLTYDAAGRATWLATAAHKMADGSYAGDLYAFAGSSFDCVGYNCEGFSGGQKVGAATLAFDDASNGKLHLHAGRRAHHQGDHPRGLRAPAHLRPRSCGGPRAGDELPGPVVGRARGRGPGMGTLSRASG